MRLPPMSRSVLARLSRVVDVRDMGREGTVPSDPLKTGTDLSNAPYVIATLIGKFKGELGTRHHLLALANVTTLGIEL